MGKGRTPWPDGRKAWERLTSWDRDRTSAARAPADEGDAALAALGDVGQIRRLLDQVELTAVQAARRHRKSWAEIAIRLGVTRQSAWERWRDLDEDEDVSTTKTAAPSPAVEAAAVQLTEQAASARRRRSTIVVPNVIGLTRDEARRRLREKGLFAVGPDPDGPPLDDLGWEHGRVTDQSPESGAKVPDGTPVTLWIEGGGGSAGVREPRRPVPDPTAAAIERRRGGSRA